MGDGRDDCGMQRLGYLRRVGFLWEGGLGRLQHVRNGLADGVEARRVIYCESVMDRLHRC